MIVVFGLVDHNPNSREGFIENLLRVLHLIKIIATMRIEPSTLCYK